MGQWLSGLKAFCNRAFRPHKLLAHKDAQLAELQDVRSKLSDALRISQEAVAWRNARLVEMGEHWTKVLAVKDAELAQSREHWDEAIAQKDAALARSREHWDEAIAQRDAELVRSREHWDEALRLAQEAITQRDARLAELADHWSKVLADKDAELAQTREHWSEALRLSQQALAQRDAELVELRAGPAMLGVGRAELSELRSRFPWVAVFGPPKSASTFVWVALSRLLNADRPMFNVADPLAPGVQLMHELDPIRMRDPQLQRRSVVFRMHVPASQHTLFHIRGLSIPAIVCTRNIPDCLVSLREELVKQWSNHEHMEVTRKRGTHEVFVGTVPIQTIERFMQVEPDRQLDMLIELATLWYLRFYQSWRCAKERHPDLIYVCRFETLAAGAEAVMRDLMAFLNRPVDGDAVSRVVSALVHDHAETNFNIGISGRGRQIMSGAQIDRVMSIARTVGAEDLLGGF